MSRRTSRSVNRRSRRQSPSRSYDAFISYSQGTDYDLAVAFQQGLQRLARPWHRRPALQVFRDETLSNSPNLAAELRTALSNSRYLIVLASPAAAQSPWVRDEIEFFLAKPPEPAEIPQRDRILIALTDGTISWEGDGRFGASSTAIPAPLQGVFDDVPKYTDLRGYRGRSDLSLDDSDFRRDVADVAAPIHGKLEGQLVLDADAKQLRIARVLRWTAVVALCVLTVAALVASVFAVRGRELAEQRRVFAEGETQRALAAEEVAVEKAAESRSRELAAQSLGLVEDDPDLAALLAVESLYPNGAVEMRESTTSTNAVGVTARALLTRSFVRSGGLVGSQQQQIVATAGRFAATVGPEPGEGCRPPFRDGVGVAMPMLWWNLDTGQRADTPPSGTELPRFVSTEWGVLRVDSDVVATPYVGVNPCPRLAASDDDLHTGSGPTVEVAGEASAPLGMPAVYDEASELLFAFDSSTGQFVTVEPLSGSVVARHEVPGDVPVWRDVVVVESTAGRIAIVTSFDGRAFTATLDRDGPMREIDVSGDAGVLAASESTVLLGSRLRDVDRVSESSLTERFLIDVPPFVLDAEFSDGGRFLALADGACACVTTVWDVSNRQPMRIATIPSTFITSMRWIGEELAVTTVRGIEIHHYRPPSVLQVTDPRVSADGSTVVHVDGSEIVVRTSGITSADEVRVDVPPGTAQVQSVSPDGRLVAVGGSMVRVVDVAIGEVVFDSAPAAVEFAPSGHRLLLSRSDDDLGLTVVVIDTETWQEVAAGELTDLFSLGWISGTELSGLRSDGGLQLLRVVGAGIEPVAVDDTAARYWSSMDGALRVTADGTGLVELRSGGDGEVGARLASFEAGTSPVTAVAVSPGNERLVTLASSEITMWDIATPRDPQRIESLDALPLVDGVGVGLQSTTGVWFRDDGAGVVISTLGSVIDLPDFDPARVCAAVGVEALDRVEEFLGDRSACRRVPELQR